MSSVTIRLMDLWFFQSANLRHLLVSAPHRSHNGMTLVHWRGVRCRASAANRGGFLEAPTAVSNAFAVPGLKAPPFPGHPPSPDPACPQEVISSDFKAPEGMAPLPGGNLVESNLVKSRLHSVKAELPRCAVAPTTRSSCLGLGDRSLVALWLGAELAGRVPPKGALPGVDHAWTACS
jgi:hypothetical protein